jgi:hypothetical protein
VAPAASEWRAEERALVDLDVAGVDDVAGVEEDGVAEDAADLVPLLDAVCAVSQYTTLIAAQSQLATLDAAGTE